MADATISEDELQEILERGRKKLFEEREKRVKPHRDEKVLTAWNGLMMAAFACLVPGGALVNLLPFREPDEVLALTLVPVLSSPLRSRWITRVMASSRRSRSWLITISAPR